MAKVFRNFIFSAIENGFYRLQGSALLGFLPIFLLLLISATDFLILTNLADAAKSLFFEELPVPYNDSRRDGAESLKAKTLQFVYIGIIFLSVLQWRGVVSHFRHWWHLILLVAYLLLGVFYSLDPLKVVTNSILILIAFLASTSFIASFAQSKRFEKLFYAVFWPMLIVHVASLYALSLYDINVIEFLSSTRRYGGLAGNPNSLGSTAVLGVWASASIIVSSNTGRRMKVLATIGMLIFLFNTALSDSATSLATILVVLLIFLWLRFLVLFKAKIRFLIHGFSFFLVILAALYAVSTTTPDDMYLAVTGSMGKDSTLSGRTDLWAIAREAIAQRPFLGWGFDSHFSVKEQRAFDVRFNHYHNGFLDTVVAGGVILLCLVCFNLFRFCQAFYSSFRREPGTFPLLVPLIILLILNISEYSLLRPNSQLWLVYFLSFTALTYTAVENPIKKRRPKFESIPTRYRRKKRKQRLRWA